MNAALKLAIILGIYNMGLKRVRAITSKKNYSAAQVLEKLNFVIASDLHGD